VKRIAARLTIAICVVVALGYILWTDESPAIVQEMRALPEVAHVDYTRVSKTTRTIVLHVRDWPLMSKSVAELEGLDYQKLLDKVERVQADQMAIVRFLIRGYGVQAVYSEGLSKDSMAGLTMRLDLLKAIEPVAAAGTLDAGELRQRRELTLTVGTPGRLLLAKEIAQVMPLEDEQALQDTNPVANGKIAPDAAKIEVRRKAMVKNLPRQGLAVVILGGSHNLEPYLPAETLYIQVTPRSFTE
jgi:hypothetical protein